MIRFGQMTEDELFVTADAAAGGVRIENRSETDPLVILKHFGPGNRTPREAASSPRKIRSPGIPEELTPELLSSAGEDTLAPSGRASSEKQPRWRTRNLHSWELIGSWELRS